MPALGVSLVLIAVGAVLAFAIDTSGVTGVNLQVIGLILVGVGSLGILMALLFLMSFSPFSRGGTETTTRVG